MTAGREPTAATILSTMATTHQPQAHETDPSATVRLDRAVDVFERVVWDNPDVCSHCFARLRTRSRITRDDWGNAFEETAYADAAEPGIDLRDPDEAVASVVPYHYKRTTCGECGSVGGLAQPETLSLDRALDRVPALLARYEEAGHSMDEAALYALVRKFKTSDVRNDDKRVFAVAAHLAREDR